MHEAQLARQKEKAEILEAQERQRRQIAQHQALEAQQRRAREEQERADRDLAIKVAREANEAGNKAPLAPWARSTSDGRVVSASSGGELDLMQLQQEEGRIQHLRMQQEEQHRFAAAGTTL